MKTECLVRSIYYELYLGYDYTIPDSFLRPHKNHTGQGFCLHIRTMISAPFQDVKDRSCPTPI